MLQNYLKIAWRNLVRKKAFSAINVIGLAISLTAFILMALYIEYELSYDRFHANAGRIYRVADDKQTTGITLHNATSPAPVAPALKVDYPEVLQTVRLKGTEALVKYKDKIFEERNLFFSDASIFNIFSFRLVKGNADNALKDPNCIVLSENMAAKYFGTDNPLGSVLLLDAKPMQVTGVVQDVPSNSHFTFDFLVSMATAEQKGSGNDWLFTNWYSDAFHTYILLPEKYNADRLAARLEDFDTRHHEAQSTTRHHYQLEKLTGIYLRSDRSNQIGKTGSISNLYIFSAIAIFILLIACFNFINLSTARSAERAKEVAVKKVAGAERIHLVGQFFTETLLMTIIAAFLSILLTVLFLPFFNAFSGQELFLNLLSPLHAGVLIVIIVFTAALSGSYPAFVLSGFEPAIALKGKAGASGWSKNFRKALVVFQFAISVILIVCSTVVYMQLKFMQNHDLGFTSAQTLIINFEGDKAVQRNYKTIKNALMNIAGVKNVTASSNIPGDRKTGGWSMDIVTNTGDTIGTEFPVYLADYNFLEQYGVQVIAGRGFSEMYAADTLESMLINESALRKLGFTSSEDALGLHVGMYPKDAKIIGVFKDFHFESLQHALEPLAIRILPDHYRLFSVQAKTQNMQQTVAAIEKTWKTLAPQRPLEYSFLDDSFNRQYNAEIKFGQVFVVFSVLAISIACLGLFGLTLFSVQQRTKEIGIRKVLGASVAGVASLLSRDFIKLVLISILIASPLAWWLMHNWLTDFAYRTNISWWIFVVAGLIAVLIAVTTVSFQAIKAARANPVKNLRTE